MSDTGGGVTPRRSRTSRPRREPANAAKGGASLPSNDEAPDDGQVASAGAATDNAVVQEEATVSGSERTVADDDTSGVSGSGEKGQGASMVRIARRAAELVGVCTGRHPESVISLERRDGGWCIGVEVIETRRIPDSADILAIYEVLLSSDGEQRSYRRVRRYARAQVDRPTRC